MITQTPKHEPSDRLAKSIAARLNHDYVSPLTAISNALEIMKLDVEQKDSAIELIQESVNTALRELQFNRIAYGSYGHDERLTVNEVNRRLNDYFISEGFELDTSAITEPPLKSEVKLWFLTILCLRSSFLTLENLTILPTSDGWKVTCAGTGMVNREGKHRAEQHWLQVEEITPSAVHFPLLFSHAQNMGIDVLVKRNDDLEIVVNLWKTD